MTIHTATVLENISWKNFPMAYSFSSVPSTEQTKLLLEQKWVLEQIADLGKNCVAVGRIADTEGKLTEKEITSKSGKRAKPE